MLTKPGLLTVSPEEFLNRLMFDLFDFAKGNKLELQTTLGQWVASILNIKNINVPAMMSKIHRSYATMKTKRGKQKEEFLNSKFINS